MQDRFDNPFWRWSLDVYQQPGVAPACLELQDCHGLNVNMALFCCWSALESKALDETSANSCLEAITAWREGVVLPLRKARRSVREASPAGVDLELFRTEIQRLELVAEEVSQYLLFQQSGTLRPSSATVSQQAEQNLAAYLRAGGFPSVDFSILLQRLALQD